MPHKGHRFTAARFFEVPKGWMPDPRKLSAAPFLPTSPTQELSVGFVAPRAGNAPGDWPFVEVVSGLHIVRMRSQSRGVPKSAVDREVAAMAARIEQETGRIPGRRETRELKDDAKQKLLPQAFPRDSELWGLICPARGVMIVSTASDTKGALLCSELIRACVDADVLAAPSKGLPALSARNLRTRTSIDAFMLQALLEPDAVKPFGPATYCVLQAQDESRRQVSYRNHELTGNEEIRRHLQMGHLPSKLGLPFASAPLCFRRVARCSLRRCWFG